MVATTQDVEEQVTTDAGQFTRQALGALRANDVVRAHDDARSALVRQPHNALANNVLGMVHQRRGHMHKALRRFERAVLAAPGNPDFRYNLALCNFQMQRVTRAAAVLSDLFHLAPRNAGAWQLLGRAQRRMALPRQALASFQRAHDLDPQNPDARVYMGKCHAELFDDSAAKAAWMDALSCDANHRRALCALSGLNHPDAHDGLYERLLDIRNSDSAFDPLVELALGRAANYRGSWDRAVSHLVRANAALADARPRYNSDLFEAHIGALRNCTSRRLLAPSSSDSPAPLLILGCSRSGKSVIEKLVTDAIPEVAAGYENQWLFQSVSALNASTGDNFDPRKLQPEYAEELQQVLSANVTPRMHAGARYVTCTRPHDLYLALPLLAADTRVRLIAVVREPFATVAGIFGKDYEAGNEYSSRIPDIVHYMTWYRRALAALRRLFPTQVLAIDYDKSIGKSAETLQKISRFIGCKPCVRSSNWLRAGNANNNPAFVRLVKQEATLAARAA